MKRSLFALAILATFAVSGVFAGKNSTVKTDSTHTYYKENECDIEITCDDSYEGTLCSEFYENTVLYSQPGCLTPYQVAIPLGRLPQ